jgi:hypothetical protein
MMRQLCPPAEPNRQTPISAFAYGEINITVPFAGNASHFLAGANFRFRFGNVVTSACIMRMTPAPLDTQPVLVAMMIRSTTCGLF